MSTAQSVLNALSSFGLKQEGQGRYRLNSPLRPGSNSHAFTLTIADDEHGSWYDHVSQEAGSLYDLARRLNVETPRVSVSSTKRAYRDMSDYAAAHGLTADELRQWMWRDVTYMKRPALEFMTHTGRRWRFLDEKGGYIHEKGYTRSWYGLSPEIVDSVDADLPLIICNGEISVVSAQTHGLCAVCVTAGEKGRIPDDLLTALEGITSPILVALDCDSTGRKAAAGMVSQLRDAGFIARAVDLGLTDGGDLADFCMLHGTETLNQIKACQTLSGTSIIESVIPAPMQRDYGLPPEKIIGQGRRWVMTETDNLKYLPPVKWLIKPYLVEHGLNVIFGPSGVGKSFFAVWLALQIAQERPVVYLAYEGEFGYRARVRACQIHYGYKKGFHIVLGSVGLMDDGDFETFLDACKKVKPAAVFVDTMARSMGDLDENMTRDMNRYVDRIDDIRSILDCAVVLVHHTSKQGIQERGSGSLRGSSDSMIKLSDEDAIIRVEASKAKDARESLADAMTLQEVDTGLMTPDGLPVYAPVIVAAESAPVTNDLTKNQKRVLQSLELEIYEDGLAFGEIQSALPQIAQSSLARALNSLVQRGYVIHEGRKEPYKLSIQGREVLNGGKPWIPPTETPQETVNPPKQGALIPDTTSTYHKAGL